MNGPRATLAPQASTAEALQAVRAFKGPLLIDLDETLYLRNSTEDFIDSARPGLLAMILLRMMDWLAPWRWTGGAPTRDLWRVRLVLLLLPWTMAAWRQRIPELVRRHGNQALRQALREQPSPVIILTLGFVPIVTPLVAAFALGEQQIIGTRTGHPEDRRQGKLALALDHLGAGVIASALALSDSIDDLPLLNASARPLLTTWPEARYQSAFSRIYVPGRYLCQVKRPGERYIVRSILQEDFAFWLLCSIGLAALPLPHTLGLLLLLLSFWTIYERGYVENDLIGARYEQAPKLSAAFLLAPVATPRWQPWLWALASGGLAILLLRWPHAATATDLVLWFGMLAGTQTWFYLYNRYDKASRVWLYAGLQLARTAVFVVLVPVAAVATLALSAHMLAKWLPYYVYRFSGKDWPGTRVALTRLMFFLIMLLVMALTQGSADLFNWTTAALLGWNLLRARQDIAATLSAAQRLDRSGPISRSPSQPSKPPA